MRDKGREAIGKKYTKARQALQDIHDIAIDYDGYRTAESLMGLVDELREIARKGLDGKYTEEDLVGCGYIHKDDPITAKSPCKECGGTGHEEVDSGAYHPWGEPIGVPQDCPNPHCREGMVEETLCVGSKCTCGDHCPGNECHSWDKNCSIRESEEWPMWYAPLTNANLGEHTDTSKWEWRDCETP